MEFVRFFVRFFLFGSGTEVPDPDPYTRKWIRIHIKRIQNTNFYDPGAGTGAA